VQLNVAKVQVQPVPVIAVTVKLVGGSVTVTAPVVAAAPAALETVIEYVAPVCPGLTFPTAEAAPVRIGVVGVGVLLLFVVQPAMKKIAARLAIPSIRADTPPQKNRKARSIAAILFGLVGLQGKRKNRN
jgi:hypothetical protein